MTFQEYLTEAQKHGIIDFAFRATQTDNGIQVYIYPNGEDGDSIDFKVEENNLVLISATQH